MKLFTLQPRLLRFLDKRIPAAKVHSLNHRSIFIFPSRFGGLFLFLCVALYVLGTNYQNNLMIMLCYFLLSLFLLNLFVSYLNFARLSVQLGKTHNSFVGEPLQLPLWFTPNNDGQGLPHGLLQIAFYGKPCSLQVDLDSFDNPTYMAMQCLHRGKLALPRVTLVSYYPLGLFRCWTHLAFDTQLLVYPQPIPYGVSLSEKGDDASPHSQNTHQRGHDDFDALAPYQPGEPLYHVAWKQLAKGRGMVTKQFSSPQGVAIWLSLHPVNPHNLEHRLSQLCFQILELSRHDRLFGLDMGHTKIAVDKGPQHVQNCLSALALYPPQQRS